ncbi:MAG: pirin-like C-terminal cupin domain-containing protein, partial [Sphingomonadaceae bacterium]
ALEPSWVMLLGGAPLGPRLLWWNLVGVSAARIRAAAEDWRAGRFPSVPGETESIPLPDSPPLPERDAA